MARRCAVLFAVLAGVCLARLDARAGPGAPAEADAPPRFVLEARGEGDYRLRPAAGLPGPAFSVPRSWLVPPAEAAAEQGDFVSSFEYRAETTAFRIGPGWLGIHLASYAIQAGGSAGAAAGRDVFLALDERSGTLHPGLVDLGVTQARVRDQGCWAARQARFLLADLDGDGATDIGVARRFLRCAPVLDADGAVARLRGPCHAEAPVEWRLFAGADWAPARGPAAAPAKPRLLPWIGIAMGPVDMLMAALAARPLPCAD